MIAHALITLLFETTMATMQILRLRIVESTAPAICVAVPRRLVSTVVDLRSGREPALGQSVARTFAITMTTLRVTGIL
jgi:hypothetical protein